LAGHSKFANIKHRKGRADAARANIFTKIGREIAVAVKSGGSDPASNSRLRDAIVKAKDNNMPNDNITRSIKKAAGELSAVNYEEIVYEGYGSGGVAVLVHALSDNRNRTAGDVRHLFDKYGGSLGTSGSVSYMFRQKGVIIVDKAAKSEDDMLMLALEAGAEDMQASEDVYVIYTEPSELHSVKEKLGVPVLSADIDYLADNNAELSPAQLETFQKLVDKLEENDDVQNVYYNTVL
jgi:YebC/PmpR family DNA-binding regulatory protein